MSPADSVCEVRRTFPQKRQKRRQKSLRKKVHKKGGTNTVSTHAFPSTVSAVFCASGVKESTCLWVEKQPVCGKQVEFYISLIRLCVFFVVISRELYVVIHYHPRINKTKSCLKI